jgi:hypothetical protein
MTPTNPTEVQMKLARECAARLAQRRRDHDYAGWIREGRKDNDSEVQSALLAIQATEARAQGLVEALEAMLHAVCHETAFANAVRNDSGVAYPWEPLDIAEASARQALATWRRT